MTQDSVPASIPPSIRAGNLLVDADWLEAHLGDSSVRIIDTSVDIVPQPPGPSDYVSRHREYVDRHIPGAAYLHMVDDLSDPNGAFPFALPELSMVRERLCELGIHSNDVVVLYGGNVHWAVHRCWWVLAVAGVDVRLLDASFDHWVAQGRPVEAGERVWPRSDFAAVAHPEWVASKDDVIASLADSGTALINSLSAEQFAGRGQPFGRAGRIPGSISVPAAHMVERSSGAFRASGELEKAFTDSGAPAFDRLITYCGGGIAASTTFFALRLLGYDNVALYDGSLLEWSADPELPLIVDAVD